VCKECKKYLLTIDIRELTDKPNMDIASIGLIPLDIKAQEEGYEPLNVLPWNTFE
jgi:FdhE protein